MKSADIRRLEMFRRVRDYGTGQTLIFPADSLGGETFAAVGTAVIELTALGAGQTSSANASIEGMSSVADARAALDDKVNAISRTARAIALDVPNLDDKFRTPRHPKDEVLIQAAYAFLKDATPLAAEFIRHELPADFLENLRQNIADLENALKTRQAGGSAYVAAGAALDSAMERGLDAVRRLDVIVVNKLGSDPTLMAAWKSARHIDRLARSKTAAASAADAAAATHA